MARETRTARAPGRGLAMLDNGMWEYVCTSCDADLEDQPSDDDSMLQGSGRGLGRGAGSGSWFGIGHGTMEDCSRTACGRGVGSAIGHGTQSADGFGGTVMW